MQIEKICVYCGSSSGARPEYMDAAARLGDLLASRKIGLVYGGATCGLMGAVADSVLEKGGAVVGVIPEQFSARVGHTRLTELHVTPTMHTRKQKMFDLSDAFIALPGGLGTLDEMFEMFTWGQLGIHAKPCGFLNIAGYYDGLIRFIDHAVQEGFIHSRHRAMIMIESDPVRMLDRFFNFQPRRVDKWTGEVGEKDAEK